MHQLEHVGVISFRLSFGDVQIEVIEEEAIFPRLDILPFAIRATHL